MENGIDIYSVRVIRTRTNLYFGVGAIQYFADIADQLTARGITSVLVVTGRSSYKRTGAWEVVEQSNSRKISYALYDRVTPNPTTMQADEATALGKGIRAQAVIAIGGGSPIDAGKSAAILLKYPDRTARDIYEYSFSPSEAVPIVAVNLTHGTGTEADRFAVVTVPEKEFKPVVAYDRLYPTWSIDDPALTVGLPPNQNRLCRQSMRSTTSSKWRPAKGPARYSIMLAKETIRLVAAYLPAGAGG
ncbi:MAG: iron-containing alcohol dehydrogenase [Victivallis sp.]